MNNMYFNVTLQGRLSHALEFCSDTEVAKHASYKCLQVPNRATFAIKADEIPKGVSLFFALAVNVDAQGGSSSVGDVSTCRVLTDAG